MPLKEEFFITQKGLDYQEHIVATLNDPDIGDNTRHPNIMNRSRIDYLLYWANYTDQDLNRALELMWQSGRRAGVTPEQATYIVNKAVEQGVQAGYLERYYSEKDPMDQLDDILGLGG